MKVFLLSQQLDYSHGLYCYQPISTTLYSDLLAHGNADGLSRLPLSIGQDESTQAEGASAIFNLSQIGILPVTCTELQTVTRNDPVLP